MRRFSLIILIGALLINLGYASDCQYKVDEAYQELELGLYDSSGNYVGPPLEFRDFVGGGMNIVGCNPPSFKIYNPLEREITLNLSYVTSWIAPLGLRTQNHQRTISIGKYSESEKLFGSCIDIGGGSISNESIIYLIIEPEIITLENEQVNKQREICKLCSNGICLNDGASCNPLYDSSKCGSGICNIAGFCGNQKVVDCPNGKLNCQDKICLESSTKGWGESYMCSFECKSDRFKNGTCLINSGAMIIFGVLVLIIFSILVAKFALIPYIKRRKDEEKKRDEAKKLRQDEEGKRDKAKEEYDALIVKKEETEKAIKDNNKNLEDLKKEKEEIERNLIKEKEKSRQKIDEIRRKENEEIKKWEDKKKNKSIEAQKAINEEINRIRLERQKEIDLTKEEGEKTLYRLKRQIQNNEKLVKEENQKNQLLSEKSQLLAEKIKEKDKEIKEIEDSKPGIRRKKLEIYYNSKYGHRNTEVFYDNERKSFRIKYPDGKVYDLYWKIYRDNIDSNLIGKHVHHINYDEEIDELWNLIALSEEEHKKIKHYNIEKGNFTSGIEELKRTLPGIEKRFHKEILDKIEEIKRIAGKYAKRSAMRRR